MRERKCDVDVAAVLEHEVSEVIRRRRIIGLNLRRLLIEVFRRLPLASGLEEDGQENVDTNIARIVLGARSYRAMA